MNDHESTTINQNPLLEGTTEGFATILERLTFDQIRFIVARQHLSTDKAAAEEVGIKPDTIKKWKHRGAPIDTAVRLMKLDSIALAREIRSRNLAKAMAVKVAGLDSDDDRMRQGVATEIIEWEMGKAEQPQKHKGTGDKGQIVIQYTGNVPEEEF